MKLKQIFLIFISIFSSCIYSQIDKSKFIVNPRIIIFDIGGTLLTVDSLKAQSYFGWDMFGYIISSFFKGKTQTIAHTKDFYLNTLSMIKDPNLQNNYNVIGMNGKLMPQLQYYSFIGKISLQDCLKIGNKWIEENKDNKIIFKNDLEKRVFQKMFNFNFDPNQFMRFQKYTKEIKLLEKLYMVKDKSGKRKNICIILSNQPKEMIRLLKSYFPRIFQFSDMQFFSCDEGLSKPDKKLFEKCISMCPKKCYKTAFFIDDEKQNIEAVKNIKPDNFNIVGIFAAEAKTILKSNYGLLI